MLDSTFTNQVWYRTALLVVIIGCACIINVYLSVMYWTKIGVHPIVMETESVITWAPAIVTMEQLVQAAINFSDPTFIYPCSSTQLCSLYP